MTRTVAAQHYSKRNGNRLRLYDEDGCLLPDWLLNTRSKTFWRDLHRALGSADKICGYASRATAQIE